MPYNEEFISCFDNKVYFDILRDKNKLKQIANNYLYRYYQNINISGEDLAIKESLDHFMLKSFLNNPKIVSRIEFQNYIEYLNYILSHNPLEMSTNPFLQQKDIDLKNLLNSPNFNLYILNRNSENNEINQLNEKIKNNQDLTQKELNKLCAYYGTKRINTKEYNNLINYIFTALPKRSDLIASYEVQNAILTYLPFAYPKFEDSMNFEPTTIRVFFTDILANQQFNSPGCSLGNKDIAVMNRKMFSNLDFKSFKNSEYPYLKRGNDFSFYMIVAFHEFTHQLQSYKSKQDAFSDQGVLSAIKVVLNYSLCDYGRNHDSDDIEIDATKVGWEACQKFYIQHYFGPGKEMLLRNCVTNMRSTKGRTINSLKEDELGNYLERGDYDVSRMNRTIKNNPNLLNIFPCLKAIYKSDGSFDYNFFTKESIWNTETGCMYLKYMILNDYENFSRFVSLKRNKFEQNNLVKNLYQGVKNNFFKLEYFTRFEQDILKSGHIQNEQGINTIDRLKKDMLSEFVSFQSLYNKIDKSNLGDTSYYVKYIEIDVIRMANPNVKIDLIHGLDNMTRSEKLNCLQSVLDLSIKFGDKKSEYYWKQRMIEIIKKEPIIISDEEWRRMTPEEQMRHYYIKFREAKLMGNIPLAQKYVEGYNKIKDSIEEVKGNKF